MKSFILNGNNFSDPDEFYSEIEKVLTKDLKWSIGRNLNAFNDVLRGGFGQFEYGESIEIIWRSIDKSKKDLSVYTSDDNKSFFEIIIEIIKGHEHIIFRIE